MDVALQTTGSFEAAYELAVLNNMSITADVATGTMLKTADVVNRQVINEYAANKVLPATKDNVLTAGGIGYWFIGYDFVVS